MTTFITTEDMVVEIISNPDLYGIVEFGDATQVAQTLAENGLTLGDMLAAQRGATESETLELARELFRTGLFPAFVNALRHARRCHAQGLSAVQAFDIAYSFYA